MKSVILNKLILILSILFVVGCKEETNKNVNFSFFFNEKAMIVNSQQINNLEGDYFKILS